MAAVPPLEPDDAVSGARFEYACLLVFSEIWAALERALLLCDDTIDADDRLADALVVIRLELLVLADTAERHARAGRLIPEQADRLAVAVMELPSILARNTQTPQACALTAQNRLLEEILYVVACQSGYAPQDLWQRRREANRVATASRA